MSADVKIQEMDSEEMVMGSDQWSAVGDDSDQSLGMPMISE